jgi:hypothetical protein
MKKTVWLFIVIHFFFQSLSANDSITGKVVFYREYNYQGSAVSYKIFLDDNLIVRLRNNSFYEYYCLPGEYMVSLNNSPSGKLRINVSPGKSYYVRLSMRMGPWTSIPEVLLVDSLSAYPAIYSGKMRQLTGDDLPFERPKNRIGLATAGGVGFKNITMFTTEDGKPSKLSFGGGYSIGLTYGREYGKNLDIAAQVSYHFSVLRPYLNNAEVTFSRGVASLTPSWIIPIDGGEYMRVKLGGGPGYYFNGTLVVKGSKVDGGFNDTWKYSNSFGYHLKSTFELNVSDKVSFNYGLIYYSTAYKYLNSEGMHSPDIPDLEEPDGSGIDLLLNICYHF